MIRASTLSYNFHFSPVGFAMITLSINHSKHWAKSSGCFHATIFISNHDLSTFKLIPNSFCFYFGYPKLPGLTVQINIHKWHAWKMIVLIACRQVSAISSPKTRFPNLSDSIRQENERLINGETHTQKRFSIRCIWKQLCEFLSLPLCSIFSFGCNRMKPKVIRVW